MSKSSQSYLKYELTEFIKEKFPTTKQRNEAQLKLAFPKKVLWDRLKALGLLDELPPPLPREQRPKRGKSKAIQIIEKDEVGNTVSRTFKPLPETELKPYDLEVDCIIRGMKTLMEHQRNFNNAFLNSNFRGVVAIHGVGSGKTLSAVVASQCYLDMFPENKVVFISPTALISNFQKELFYFYFKSLNEYDNLGFGKYNPLTDPRFKFYSFEAYSRTPQLCNNSLLIIDEAHNLRTTMNITPVEIADVDGNPVNINMTTKNRRGFNILENCGKLAHKVLLLSGTPYINKPEDIENLMAIIDGREPNYASEVYKFDTVDDTLKDQYSDYFGYKVSLFLPSEEWKKQNFPERRDNYVFFNLNEDELQAYNEKIEDLKQEVLEEDPENENPNAFYSLERQAVNTYEQKTKLKFIGNLIGQSDTAKTLVYSNFLSQGSTAVAKELTAKYPGLTIGFINSNVSKNEKDRIVSDYNADKIRVVFLSRAGAEGLSFIKTTNVIVLEPNWNQALVEQIVARGIRAGSHKMLPENERYVNAWYLTTSVEETSNLVVKYISERNIPFYDIYYVNPSEGIEKLSKEKIDEIKNLPLQDNLRSIKPMSVPVDIKVLAMSLQKQDTINTCLDLIGEVPKLEQAVNPVIEIVNTKMKEYQEKNGKEMPYSDILKIKREYFDSIVGKQTANSQNIYKNYWKRVLDELKLMVKRTFPITKDDIQLFNFFPTPSNIVDKMIDISDIEKETKQSINCLEPTAGIGNIPARIYDKMKDKQVAELKFDFVELNEGNRKSLIKIFGENPFIRLFDEPDFMEATISTEYDYVFMNPPYDIKQEVTAKQLYDIDFVEKAFGLLKDGGKLIAIVSPKYKNNNDFMNKYKKYIYHEEDVKQMYKDAKETEGIFKSFKTKVSLILLAMKKPVRNRRRTKRKKIRKS